MSDEGRPIGISVLAVLYFLGGLLALGIVVLGPGSMPAEFEELGVSGLLIAIRIIFWCALGIAAGVGMWTRKRWGWWLGAFWLFYSIARNVNALLMLPGLVEQFGAQEVDVAKYQLRFAGRIAVSALLILYFFKSNVVAWFGVGATPGWKRVALLAGATIGILALFAAASLLSGGEAQASP